MLEKKAHKKTAKKTVRKTVRKRTAAVVKRKAPTRVAANSVNSKRNQKVLLISTGVFVVVFCVSVLIGMTDKGEIEVSSTIEDLKAKSTPEEVEQIESVENRSRNQVPRGGLVPAAQETAPKPKNPTPPQPTASSSLSSASSTEVMPEEEVSESTAATSSESSEEVADIQ